MHTLLQVDFPLEGNAPWGNEMSEAFNELAQSINHEAGLIWKIWTENPNTKEAGGVYLFANEQAAKTYLAMHTARLNSMGISQVRGKLFSINQTLSLINHAPLPNEL